MLKLMRKHAKILFQMSANKSLNSRCFFPPTLIELTTLAQLTRENFGPILHIIRYHSEELSTDNRGY